MEKDLMEITVNDLEQLRGELKKGGEKIYEVGTTIQTDDEEEIEKIFFFKKPNVSSYDRYIKTVSTSSTKALTVFIKENVCKQQRMEMEETLEEYPAFALKIGEKLLAMLGLSKTTTVKKL